MNGADELPEQNHQSRSLIARAICDEMAKGGDETIESLMPLTADDCCLIGKVIQIFASCDLSARRALDIIDRIEGKPVPDVKNTPRDNEVLSMLAERSTSVPVSVGERAAVIGAIERLSQFAQIRHQFAHWTVRRHPTHDALVMLTFNRREMYRKLNQSPEHFKAAFGIVEVPVLERHLPSIEHNANFISARVTDWYRRFVTE